MTFKKVFFNNKIVFCINHGQKIVADEPVLKIQNGDHDEPCYYCSTGDNLINKKKIECE